MILKGCLTSGRDSLISGVTVLYVPKSLDGVSACNAPGLTQSTAGNTFELELDSYLPHCELVT